MKKKNNVVNVCVSSVGKDIEESLVELFLPEHSLGVDSDDDEGVVRSQEYVNKLTLLGVKLIVRAGLISARDRGGHRHIHLYFSARKIDVIVVITDDKVLVSIMPEKRMGLYFDYSRRQFIFTGSGGSFIFGLIPVQVLKLDWDDRAGLRVFNFKLMILVGELKPVISVELSHEFTLRITEGKLLRVTREHDFSDVNLELLALLRDIDCVEQDIIYTSFFAAHHGLSSIFVQEHGLSVQHYLFLQF
jgi:hypothetical protein